MPPPMKYGFQQRDLKPPFDPKFKVFTLPYNALFV